MRLGGNEPWLGSQDELRDAVLLVFANKQDLPNAMNAAEITDKLGLHSLRQRHWCVFLPHVTDCQKLQYWLQTLNRHSKIDRCQSMGVFPCLHPLVWKQLYT